MTEIKMLAGRPITGDVENAQRPIDQRPIADLIELIDAVLNLPGVEAVKWQQCTPGWNDGEPCTFSATESEVRTESMDEDTFTGGSDWPDGYWDTHARQERRYDPSKGEYVNLPLPPGMLPATYSDWGIYTDGTRRKDIESHLGDLSRALESGAYDHALIENFGDPSEIVATLEGFHVETYDCGY